jgi:hypothetical protein
MISSLTEHPQKCLKVEYLGRSNTIFKNLVLEDFGTIRIRFYNYVVEEDLTHKLVITKYIIYLEHHSVCLLVRIETPPPPLLSQASVATSQEPKGVKHSPSV